MQYAAACVPVAENNALCGFAVQFEIVYSSAVRVTVEQGAHTMLAHETFDGGLIDVKYLGPPILAVLGDAGLPYPSSDALPPFERQCVVELLYCRIADDTPEALIPKVVSAKQIAVAQQHRLATDVNQGWVMQQNCAAGLDEAFAKHEITIAVHDVAARPACSQFRKCRGDGPVVRIRVVVTDPVLEQVAEDVERIRCLRFGCKKMQECINCSRT